MNMQRFDEYQLGAIRTMPDLTQQDQIVHCLFGMAGEAGEVFELQVALIDDNTAYEKEIGDCLWYSAVLGYTAGDTLSSLIAEAVTLDAGDVTEAATYGDRLVIFSSRLIDVAKKAKFYSGTIDWGVIRPHVLRYLRELYHLTYSLGVSFEEVCDKNLSKLRARFPDKFDAEKAINRDVAAEDAAMEVKNA